MALQLIKAESSASVAEIAERPGRPEVGNRVVLGAQPARIGVVSKQAVCAALPLQITGSEDLLAVNRRAVEAGMECVS